VPAARYDGHGLSDEQIARIVVVRRGRWRLVTMDTGHWPMFSQPRELAQIFLDAGGE